MRYISPLYDEEFLVQELAQMRLTGDARVLEPLHDRRGLVASTASVAAPEEEPTFSAAQLRTIMQSLGLSRAETMDIDHRAAPPAQRSTTSRSLATSTPASRHRRCAGRKLTATGSTKSSLRFISLIYPTTAGSAVPNTAGVTGEATPSSPFHSSIAVVTNALSTTHTGVITTGAPIRAPHSSTTTVGTRRDIHAAAAVPSPSLGAEDRTVRRRPSTWHAVAV